LLWENPWQVFENTMHAPHTSHHVRLFICIVVAIFLPGCALWQNIQHPQDAHTDMTACSVGLNPADNTRLAGIEQLVRDNKPYAALAQLDALKSEVPAVKLTRADALRRIDHTAEAQALYQSLAGGCMDGRAQHGLGLMAAQQGQLADSVKHLQLARQAMPTDLRVRNDLGYALLLSNRLDDARFEFLTVLDLQDKEPRASRNLVLLTFKQGQPDKARELGRRLGLDAEATERLAAQAAKPLSADPTATVSFSITPSTKP
jgi:Flp pilus assembly protein TadD